MFGLLTVPYFEDCFVNKMDYNSTCVVKRAEPQLQEHGKLLRDGRSVDYPRMKFLAWPF